jgi:DNA-binding response OmpR family regulator
MYILASTPSHDVAHDPTPANSVRPPVLFAVDDDVNTLELLCEIARENGWLAKGFTRISGLRRSLDTGRPTLLILDDDLPDGRGGDLARELHEDDRLADVPILVCTAAHPMRQAEIGAWAPVVSKPFDVAQVEAFLAAAHRRQSRSDRYGQEAG